MKHLIVPFIITALFLSCKSNTKPEPTPKTVSGKIVYDSTEIAYTVSGEGDTTILFLHGWGINRGYWDSQIDYFEHHYKVYAVDLPGFGESVSTRKDYTIENYSHDIIKFMDTLQLRNVILVGHSMSGDIILETALQKNPAVIGIIGIDNFKMLDVAYTPEQVKSFSNFADSLTHNLKKFAPLYAYSFLFHTATDTAVRKRVMDDYASMDSAVGIFTLFDLMRYSRMEGEKLSQLTMKLNLVNTDAYPTNIEGLKKYCKSSFALYEISSAGHFPMIEKPEEFNRQLGKAIRNIR